MSKAWQGFDDLDSSRVVILFNTATWCSPCKTVYKLYEELAEEYSDNIKFLKMDVDDFKRDADKLKIKKLPTFIIFYKGEEIERYNSADKERLINTVKKYAK